MKNKLFISYIMLLSLNSSAQAGLLACGSCAECATIDVLSRPSSSASVVGKYYAGTYVDEIEEDDGFIFVRIGDNNSGAAIEGYVSSNNVVGGEIFDIKASIKLMRTVAKADKQMIALYVDADHQSRHIGSLLPGTFIKVIGETEEFYHVYLGNVISGFIHKDFAVIADAGILPDGTMPSIGYCQIVAEETKDRIASAIYTLADTDSEIVYEVSAGYGVWLELIADLGEWCQVRSYSDNHIGFMKRDLLALYPLIATDSPSVFHLTGPTIVGKELDAGLYTIKTDKPTSFSLEHSGNTQSYTLPDAGSYTYYFPMESMLTPQSALTLAQTTDGYIPSAENGWSISSNGRYLMGSQVQRGFGEYMTLGFIALVDGAENGYYEVSDFLGNLIERVDMEEGVTYYPAGTKGTFIQIYNGILTLSEPKG